MAYTIQIKKGQLNVEKALQNMDYDVVKFESELMMLAKHQSPRARSKLLNQYVKYMRGCGFKLTVRGIGKTKVSAPDQESTPKHTQKPTPETTQKATPEPKIEVAPQIAKQEIKVPESVPQPEPTATREQTPETPKEQPQAETVKTDTALNDLHPETVKKPEPVKPAAYFTYPDANLFKKLYESMCVLVGEITWKFTADSLTMRQMDPSRVALIDLKINKEEFEEYAVKTPGLVTFSAEEIKKAVFAKAFQKGTSIGVKIDDVTERITFVIKDNRTRERSFPTLEAEQENIPTPKISFNAKYKIIAKTLAEDIKELTGISDHITIIGDTDSFQMVANGDVGYGQTTYKRGDENLLDIEVREKSKAVFSLSYLKDFVNPAICDLALIEFATDMPMKITNQTKFGDLIFYMAPHIESE